MIDTSWAVRVERENREPESDRGFPPRSAWGEGPWQDEPDLVEWRHGGMACLMVRGPSGSWCGYVGLPGSHPAFGKHYDKVPEESAHGGLTFSGTCRGDICHVAGPGEPEHVWWLGFDCAHSGDLSPGMNAHLRAYRLELPNLPEPFREKYRTLAYVKTRVEMLADELKPRKVRAALIEDAVAGIKLFFRRDLPQMFRELYLEQDHLGRGPCERAAMELAYGGDNWRRDGLMLVANARAKDRPWQSRA